MQCFTQLQEEIEADWKKSKKTPKEEAPPKLAHPIREHRRLNRVTPHEMTRRLIKTGFVTKAKHPQIIQDILAFHHYDLHKS